MEVSEVTLPSFKVAGISVRTNNINESDSSKSKIAPLYKKYFSEKTESKIPNKLNENVFMGVYTDYESDHNGDYCLIIAKEVYSLENIPESFETKEISACKYLKFTNEGEMPAVVIDTWKYIWKYFSEENKHNRAYITDFEKYDITVNNKVDIFISIK